MSSTRIAIIIGTRPEAIKMTPVYRALRDRPGSEPVLIATAQHRDMLDQALNVFGIEPDIDLDLMTNNQTPSDVTARILTKLKPVLADVTPDGVLVHGDTTTSLAGALCAFYQQIPIGHVEAGLRTYDFSAPWPEEMNRRLVDPICRWCFAPTAWAADNLRAERIPEDNIFVTGNTVVDALMAALDQVREAPPEIPELPPAVFDRRIVLVTGHRRESFGQPFEQVFLGIRDIADAYEDVSIVYPVHLNPNVQEPARRILGNCENVHLIPPLPYLGFVHVMDRCELIITDSGGIQEEAPSLRKPVLVTRRVTERPEALESGCARLIGAQRQAIAEQARKALDDSAGFWASTSSTNPYGDGKASSRIVDILCETLQCE